MTRLKEIKIITSFLGVIFTYLGRKKEAVFIKEVQINMQLIALSLRLVDIHYQLGIALYELVRNNEVLNDYSNAIEMNP